MSRLRVVDSPLAVGAREVEYCEEVENTTVAT